MYAHTVSLRACVMNGCGERGAPTLQQLCASIPVIQQLRINRAIWKKEYLIGRDKIKLLCLSLGGGGGGGARSSRSVVGSKLLRRGSQQSNGVVSNHSHQSYVKTSTYPLCEQYL